MASSKPRRRHRAGGWAAGLLPPRRLEINQKTREYSEANQGAEREVSREQSPIVIIWAGVAYGINVDLPSWRYDRHAIVEELAALGARVHTCSRNTVELEACRQGWEEKNLHVTVSVCDVSVRADREKLMDTVRRAFGGKLDVLVNNAGQSMVKAATECTGEDYARIMATNLESCFHLAQLADPLLLSGGRGGGGGGGGSVVHISSIAGFVGFAGLAVYSMTKGAMNQLTRSLAAEWAGDGIRVNCVAPGGINTDIAKDVETMDPEMVNS
ncbi:hypothetical protein ACQ4PT_064153 [Festuca glaucescens]